MQVAYYQDKVIYLPAYDREKWQQLYMASTKGDITCIHCHVPLRMEIGIEKPAAFYHPQKTDECSEATTLMETKFKKEQSTSEQVTESAFQIPVRRSISNSENSDTAWKSPETIKAIPPFHAKINKPGTSQTGYRLTLRENGIQIDDKQWEAVTTTEGPLLILAGAGSGKTRVLTSRTAYMLAEQHYSPRELILITFTAKAAKEMKDRMQIYPGIDSAILKQLVVGTFHSIFYKMLLHHEPVKWDPANLLKFDWQRQAMLKEAAREIDIDEKEFAFDQALTQISWWKNHLLSPEQVKTTDIWEERTAYLYKRYEQMKGAKAFFDFDDMLLGTYQLLSGHPALLRKYQQRFSYVSVDEFQDINKVQFQLISMLTEPSKNLCVVGDDDQSIYAFRGSDPAYILSFPDHYPNSKVVILNENYRSNHEIISSANNVIATNRTRFPKTLQAQTSIDQAPLLFYPYDEEEEATMVVTDIKKQIEQGAKPRHFAILFRTNSAARAMIERFISSCIPFQLDIDGESFYRRKAIRRILAYLRLALNPDDTHALTDLVAALFLKQQVVQEIKSISILKDCTFVEALPQIQGLQPFQSKKLSSLPEKFKQLAKKSPVEAISFIESDMGFNDYIKKQGNEGNKMEKGSDDIRDLKVVATQHTKLQYFLDYVDHMTTTYENLRKQRGQQEAVQLMTIHRAKGLEFKHVYLIGAVEGGLPHDYALDAWRDGNDKPIEEERRLAYVAITRSEESLKVSVPMMRRGKKAFRSRFVREMQRFSPKQQLSHPKST
ncbi:ATP-dependent helicase [bacterium LRH843]|nr:ATP-dependent helicase [bacterium LRH843]